MNRRDFTRGLVSLGLTPALPIPALGSTTSTAVATATADKMYFMGWYTARLNKTCSPEVLVSELNVNKDVAHEIFNKLVKTKTITPPNALGVSRAVDPLNDSYRRVTRKAANRVVTEHSKGLKRPKINAQSEPTQTEEEPVDDINNPLQIEDAETTLEIDTENDTIEDDAT